MKKWEYMSCCPPDRINFEEDFINFLNNLGQEGWEVVARISDNEFLLKREITNLSTESSAKTEPPALTGLPKDSPVLQALQEPISLLTPEKIRQLQQKKKSTENQADVRARNLADLDDCVNHP